MPMILPAVVGVVLLVALVSFEMVLPEMLTVPVPSEYIPKTSWTQLPEAEAALMLLAVEVLPIVLLLMVVVPAVADLWILQKLFGYMEFEVLVVIAPMVLFLQSTVPVQKVISIP